MKLETKVLTLSLFIILIAAIDFTIRDISFWSLFVFTVICLGGGVIVVILQNLLEESKAVKKK